MCSILGICDFNEKLNVGEEEISRIGQIQEHRGKDQNGVFISDNICFQHNRLAVIDVEKGLQPMTVTYKGLMYTIVYNGELYNTNELKSELEGEGVHFATSCDTEVVLYAYIVWGKECSCRLNGIFAFVVYDYYENKVYFSRDRLGVKPFFYTIADNKFIFSSEIKGLLKCKGVKAEIDTKGIWELLFFSPMRINGSGVFKNILELKPAENGFFNKNGLFIEPYWCLKAEENEDSEATIIEKTRYLLTDAIKRQLVSDVPLCTFLSGGLDSSIISSVATRVLRAKGERLSTYSFEYEGNKEFFKSTLFQPQSDDEYAKYCAQYLGTDHSVLTASTETVANYLNNAVMYRDLPGMADIDSSLLYYCSLVKERHTVGISGECADEIFGGYPWFYRPEMLGSGYFPWIHSPMKRAQLFNDDFAKASQGLEFAKQVYSDSLKTCPLRNGEDEAMKSSRIATWLSVNWFMTSLLERKDRMSMASSVEVRVPFADHRILEYVYNIPWEIKYKNNTEKWLLREAMKDFLPEKILNRKKSPYPKTRNPKYEIMVLDKLQNKLLNSNTILKEILCKDVIEKLQCGDDSTWFGQLMSKPQLIAWLLQLDFWIDYYNVKFV